MTTAADDVDVVDATPKAQQRRHFRFVAPAVEFSNALKAVHPIAVPNDTAAQFDSIRIDVREDSTVTVSAANPMMMGAAEVPGVDVIASGSVDVAPRVAKELAEVAIQKVTNSGPVEVEVAASADFIEIALVYGLPFEPHKTRRPVQSPRQPLEGVAKHVSEVLQEVHAKERSSAMVSQSGVLTRATPAQEVALQKAARAIGAVVTRFPSTAEAKFVATAPQLAVVWVCNPDGSDSADGDEEKLDGVDEQQNTGSPVARRVVVARPLGGLS
ncbi:hypothetical protein CRD08_00140 [Corynebacterium sp. LK15]|uniref:hypothetical protein n=1 Tax=Corynebacterium sp. LK15 TaxID=2044585 RepID=UPI001651E693|nr:hypothetical protein [Corynebacterium sp. LK15]MBC6767346.1 hypothetical protein [Corynebacterium sp. LK15]